MIFEALPARFGDCLLLHVPADEGRKLMVIDGGPGTVFRDSLSVRLKELSAPGQTLRIGAVMVSHVDADHIVGIIDLLNAVQKAKIANTKPPYRVDQLIFNSFDAISQARPDELSGPKSVTASIAGAGSSIILQSHTAMEVLASVAQGSTLTSLAKGLKIPINPGSSDGVLYLEENRPPTTLEFGDAEFLVVGPRKLELEALRKKWDAWRATKAKKELEALAAYADTSVPNLSSVVALATWNSTRILLTGDARGDYILEGLEKAGALKPGKSLDAPLDILKLPHHGSSRNIDLDFFKRLPARHIVASGDGWYGNPDKETLEMIEEACTARPLTLHLTYDGPHMDDQHRKYLAQQTKPKDFIAKKHSVIPVLQRLVDAGVSIRYGRARIDLGAE